MMEDSTTYSSQPQLLTYIKEFARKVLWAIGYSSHVRASFRKHRHEQPIWNA